MALKNNTWKLNQWYDQDVAGNVSYSGVKEFWLWGKQEHGAFGINIGGNIYRSSPVQLPGATWQTEFYNNQNQGGHVVMAKTDGTLWSWGKNTDWGQLGHNTRANNISSPTQLPGTDWKLGGTTREGSFAIKTSGELYGWGSNNRGELGQNDRNARSSPTQIPGSWDKAFGGYNTILAIKTDGSLWGIGEGAGGRLGQNSSKQFSSPVQIPGSWSSASMDNAYGAGAINTDGELWMFGYNASGVLGQNNTTQYSSPVQVPGTWSIFENAGEGAAGRKTDGTLWTWGTNSQGVLGQNQGPSQLDYVSSPVQVGSDTNWNAISFAYGKGMGTKTDGTLWTWGSNTSGMLGQNQSGITRGAASSPVQVPGTSWATVGHGGQSVTVYATKNV